MSRYLWSVAVGVAVLNPVSSSLIRALVSVLFAVSTLGGQSTSTGGALSATPQVSSPGHHVVILLDINPHQKKVLPVELLLAKGIIQKLGRGGFAFSAITFGSGGPTLLKAGVAADEVITAIGDVTVEQTKEKYFSIRFYDAVDMALRQFSDHGPNTLLVISEGNDYFPHKTFKETVARAQQLHVACDVAMVADHTFYSTKAIQHYGFNLRRLAGKTHGQYIEVGEKQKKVPHSIERLSEGILSRGKNRGKNQRTGG